MDVQWVKIRSWHAVKPNYRDSRWENDSLAFCGRRLMGAAVDDLPDEKSCESCLRILAREADR